MNKYNISPKAAEAAKAIVFICICAGFILVWVVIVRRVFSPPGEPGQHRQTSHLSAMMPDAPVRFYSTIERQRIMQKEGIYKGLIDGKRGDLTITAEKEHAKLYNDWCNRQEMKVK